jgi:hypothetical protein
MEPKVRLTLCMKRSTIRSSKEYAAIHGTSVSHLAEHFLTDLPEDDSPASRRRWWENYERAHPIGGPARCNLETKSRAMA